MPGEPKLTKDRLREAQRILADDSHDDVVLPIGPGGVMTLREFIIFENGNDICAAVKQLFNLGFRGRYLDLGYRP